MTFERAADAITNGNFIEWYWHYLSSLTVLLYPGVMEFPHGCFSSSYSEMVATEFNITLL